MCSTGADAISELRSLLAGENVIYWLDAHWCATPDGEATEGIQCELLEEIAGIGQLSASSVVLIDDARLFLSPPPPPHDSQQWPTFQQVLNALTKASSTHEVAVINDVIAFYPPSLARALNDYAAMHGVDWLTVTEKSRQYDSVLADNVAKERVIQELSTRQPSAESSPLWAEMRSVSRPAVDSALRIRQRSGLRGDLSLRSLRVRPFKLVQHAPRPPRVSFFGNWATEMPRSILPSIAVAMPSFNQDRYIGASIRSVISQHYPRLQFVVQDGASQDESVHVIENFRNNLLAATSEPDEGQADAINRAFAKTDAEIMGWLNSDDILLPGALHVIGNYFASHPDVDVVYASRLVIDEADLEVGRWIVPPNTHDYLDWADYIPQETLYWRRSLWERAGGGLDASMSFAMDWELLLRFKDAGANFACIPQTLGAFRVHALSKTIGAIDQAGESDMRMIRSRRHGRHVTHREISSALTPLYARAWQTRLLRGMQ